MVKLEKFIRPFIGLSVVATATLLSAAPALAVPVYGNRSLGQETTLTYHRSDWVKINSKNSGTLKWNCPTNSYTVGGGFETRREQGNSSNGFTVIHSFPSSARQWEIRIRNQDDIPRDVRIYNICAK